MVLWRRIKMDFQKGDLVTRTSYKHDLLFRVQEIKDDGKALLYGEYVRLEADAPVEDILRVDEERREKWKRESEEKEDVSFRLFRQDYQMMHAKREYEVMESNSSSQSYFQLPSKVLHIDGDAVYLKKCIQLYQRLGLQIHGVHVSEKEMPHQIGSLIEKINPDIVIITGHDSYSKNKGQKSDLRAYRHSKFFVETVREARKKVPHLDQLIIFAGACQSHFESLIRAGANFASSPSRVNIHALDPVYIAAKISYTPFMEKARVWDVLRNTLTGEKGLGGVETRGLLRTGMPYSRDDMDL